MRPNDSRATAKKALRGGGSRRNSAGLSVAIIGIGRLGSALALALDAAGVTVDELVVRGRGDAAQKKLARAVEARISSWSGAKLDADLVWLCVADGEIAGAAAALASRWRYGKKPRVLLHASGVLGSEVLAPARKLGIATASAHPFQSFPQPAVEAASLRGVFFGVEGEATAVKAARAMISAMGGGAFSVDASSKALYHAFGSFASPLLVALLSAAQHAGERAGVAPKTVAKLLRSLAGGTFANWHQHGAEASFSGPIVRGDAETIRLHLASLESTPELDAIYRSLAGHAVERLPGQRKHDVRAALKSGETRAGKRRANGRQSSGER